MKLAFLRWPLFQELKELCIRYQRVNAVEDNCRVELGWVEERNVDNHAALSFDVTANYQQFVHHIPGWTKTYTVSYIYYLEKILWQTGRKMHVSRQQQYDNQDVHKSECK
ncbi:hypothetical protein R1flu_004027 [Riccia fluitans]|uniref:Uncharacterized protein n=1 Tax=Riccia fluitans TaxID=41844 RepID=A0ABD1YPE2_9MARC